MSPNRRRALTVVLVAGAVALLVAPDAFAAAGGGSSGFSGGGGGGGRGNGFALYLLFDLLIHIAVLGHGLGALVLVALGLAYLLVTKVFPAMGNRASDWTTRRPSRGARPRRGRTANRERRVALAAAEAAETDPAYAADSIVDSAGALFRDIQTAWDADDRVRLRGLVVPELLVEWERRLDDFAARGWRNRVQPLGDPAIELVALAHTGDPDHDHVVVRLEARCKDYVVDRSGRHLKRTGRLGETTRIREFWTLTRPAGHWLLASVQEAREGAHAMDEPVVATPWADDRALRDAALLEGAAADAVPTGTSIAEVADLSYDGDAHAAAMDLSVADGRFAPAVLEVAARRAVDAWARAIDGSDDDLRALASPQAVRELLYAGDTSNTVRVVGRGPEVRRIRVVSLDAGATPPTMTIEVDLAGRRYLENRDTAAVLAGSRTRTSGFTERWTLALTGDGTEPWRIVAAAAPVGLR